MHRSLGRRLDDLEAALVDLKGLPDIFEPGRGTAPETLRTEADAHGPPPRRPVVPAGYARFAAVPVSAPAAPAPSRAMERLDTLCLLWEMVGGLAEGDPRRARVAAALPVDASERVAGLIRSILQGIGAQAPARSSARPRPAPSPRAVP